MNKIRLFLFITCLCSLVHALSAADTGNYNPDARGGAQSRNIGEEEAEPKDPLLATLFSVFPGVVIHGFGNFYAGDYDNGTRMLTMEILGGGIALWAHNLIHNPDAWGAYFGDQTVSAGYWIKAGGVGLIAISFIWDVATAGEAAQSYNKDHQINFQLESRLDGMQFALTHHF